MLARMIACPTATDAALQQSARGTISPRVDAGSIDRVVEDRANPGIRWRLSRNTQQISHGGSPELGQQKTKLASVGSRVEAVCVPRSSSISRGGATRVRRRLMTPLANPRASSQKAIPKHSLTSSAEFQQPEQITLRMRSSVGPVHARTVWVRASWRRNLSASSRDSRSRL